MNSIHIEVAGRTEPKAILVQSTEAKVLGKDLIQAIERCKP